jgi:hypothetical protein
VREMGLDGAMYLCHMRLCGRYWLTNFLSVGLVKIFVYQFGCDENSDGQWTDLYSFSFANLKPEYRWVTVVFGFYMTFTVIYFCGQRQKVNI